MPKTKSAKRQANGAAIRSQNAARRRAAAQAANVKPGAYKSEEARHYLGGISVPSMHRAIKRGLLKPNRSLRHLLFPVAELDRFLKDGMA
jgi:Helix-turn-helix domain